MIKVEQDRIHCMIAVALAPDLGEYLAAQFRMFTMHRKSVNRNPILPGTVSIGRRKLICKPKGQQVFFYLLVFQCLNLILRSIYLIPAQNSWIRQTYFKMFLHWGCIFTQEMKTSIVGGAMTSMMLRKIFLLSVIVKLNSNWRCRLVSFRSFSNETDAS